MKKYILALAAVAAGLSASATYPSDRIDLFTADGTFHSIMADDIAEITLGQKGADGFTTVNVALNNGTTVSGKIADYTKIKYNPLDINIPFAVEAVHDEHSTYILWDCHNNEGEIDPSKPETWTGAEPSRLVHFSASPQKGYAVDYTLTGQYTGKEYTKVPGFIWISDAQDNTMGLTCPVFEMPFEPVLLGVTSEELTTYEGAAFLGDYAGYSLKVGDSRLMTSKTPDFNVVFRANGTYTFTTTDANKFDITDLYSYNEQKNTIAYVPYDGVLQNEGVVEVKHGLNGDFMPGDFFRATVIDILNNRPETNLFYFAGKPGFEIAVASADEYGDKILVQVTPTAGGDKKFYYSENAGFSMKEVSFTFTAEKSIATKWVEGYAKDGEDVIFKYEIGNSNVPAFTFRGAEYGTYTGVDGDLALDGYGKCTLGQQSGTYTLSGGIAAVTIGSETSVFVVDRTAKTYVKMASDAWTGKSMYVKADASGSFEGGELNNLNSITILMDQELNGNELKGYASVKIEIARNDGFSGGVLNAVASGGNYIYDASTKTLVITNVYVGPMSNRGRTNLTLKVSDDMASMWFDAAERERIYATGDNSSYVVTGTENTLEAPVPALPELAAQYTGAIVVDGGFSTLTSETTLTIDKDQSKATLKVVAMNTDMWTVTADYVLEGETFTMKDVTCGNGTGWGTLVQDLVFTIQADGSLQGSQDVYPSGFSYGTMKIMFGSAPLTPAE